MNPKISVIISCFNYGPFIEDAVDSVLAQTFQSFEIIIVDDASTDSETINTVKQVAQKDPRISTILLTQNGGAPHARNTGITKAKGEYIIALDADDKLAPTYLEKTLAIIEDNPQIGGVYTLTTLFGDKSGLWDLKPFSPQLMLFENMVFCPALYRKSDWEKYGGYSDEMRKGINDWEFWLHFIEDGKIFVRIEEPLFYYYVKKNSLSSSASLHKPELLKIMKKRHRSLYTWKNYYFTKEYIKRLPKKIRKFLFWFNLKKKRVRILGVYLMRP